MKGKKENIIKSNQKAVLNVYGEEIKDKEMQKKILYWANQYELPVIGITMLAGKPYVNTAGLLLKTHQLKPKKIYSKPIQLAKQVGDIAIFEGIVELQDGRLFSDIGTASSANIKMSTIRVYPNEMASRRAINRAMRLATAVGITSVEEIGEPDNSQEQADMILTDKEFKEIIDFISQVEGISNKNELENIRKILSSVKKDFNENQIKYLAKIFKKKEEVYGTF